MAKMNLNEHKTTYDSQGQAPRPKVKTGAYVVVNVHLTRATAGQSGKPKIKVKTYVLAAYKPENKDAKATDFAWDLWADFTKKFNAQRLTHQIMAHGNDAMLTDFDPDDDRSLVAAITGVPYAVLLEVSSRDVKGSNGKSDRTFVDIEVREAKALSSEQRKKYTELPDWKTIVGLADQRLDSEETATRNSGSSSDDPRGDDEAPPPEDAFAGDPFEDPAA